MAPPSTEYYPLSLHDALPILMEAALSMRQYTVSQVRDKLVQKDDEFLPQTVPAFAATEMMNQLRQELVILDRKSTRLNSSHTVISYAVFCLKKKKKNITIKYT